MGTIVLSGRMQAVADLVTHGSRVCDVGCDHGFVSIYLVQHKISPGVLAMDVREGPLRAAKEHVQDQGLEELIETRLSDGLHKYNMGEADSLICAGMGGKLMMRILLEQKEKTDSFRELILQPQSELEWFRGRLRDEGYYIVQENMIEEDGKFYPMMRAVKEKEQMPETAGIDRTLGDRYGALLLQNKSEVLQSYLHREERIYQEIMQSLAKQGLEEKARKDRFQEMQRKLADTERALEIMQ